MNSPAPSTDHHDRAATRGADGRDAVFARFDLNAARSYDAWYQTEAGHRMALAEERLLAALLRRLPGVGSVLDVGCGTGHFSRWVGGRGLSVLGLDPSLAMLAVAHERGGAEYLLGTAEELPLAAASVDVAALITSLEFVADPRAALAEAGRVARRGVLLGVLNLASPLGVRRTLSARLRPSPYRHARFFTPWALTRLVRTALDGRAASLTWHTTIRPGWLPASAGRSPFGGFIGMVVRLNPPPDEEANR